MDLKEQNGTDFVDKRPKLLRETGKWVMGKSIQACYVMEDIDSTASCSMAFRPIKKPVEKQNDDPDSKRDETITSPAKQDADSSTIAGRDQKKMIPLAPFRSWNKLPKWLSIHLLHILHCIHVRTKSWKCSGEHQV